MTKKEGKVWNNFCRIETVRQAIWNAAKGKRRYRRVRKIVGKSKDSEEINASAEALSQLLKSGNFVPTYVEPRVIQTEYGKEREIIPAVFYPDCCVHHGISLVMRPRWVKALTDDTYACIVGRGINSRKARHNLNRKMKRVLAKYFNKPLFGEKLDISKCYPNVDNDILDKINSKYCKDGRMLDLLRLFNYHHKGLAIGSFLSQLWINILLNELDRYVKEVLHVKYYFRYMDDIVILSEDKHELQTWMRRIMNFLWYELHFEVNRKRQVFPIGIGRAARGEDFGGYVFKRRHTGLRKRIKKTFIRRRHNKKSVASYWGILKHCDSKNLIREVIDKDNGKMRKLTDLGITIERRFEGERIAIDSVLDKRIVILDFELRQSTKKENSTFVMMQVGFEGKKRFIKGGYRFIADTLRAVNPEDLPLETVIHNNKGYYFEGTIDTNVDYDYDD